MTNEAPYRERIHASNSKYAVKTVYAECFSKLDAFCVFSALSKVYTYVRAVDNDGKETQLYDNT